MNEPIFLYVNYAVSASFLVGLVALLLLVINLYRFANQKKLRSINDPQFFSKLPIKSMMVFVGSIILVVLFNTIVCNLARSKTLDFLESLPNAYTVFAEGHPVSDGKNLITALETVHKIVGHHSSPSKTIHVVIEANSQVLHLNLCRDSQMPREYWVFSLGDPVSSTYEIGRISTDTLDSF
jgi:hypothetical protein